MFKISGVELVLGGAEGGEDTMGGVTVSVTTVAVGFGLSSLQKNTFCHRPDNKCNQFTAELILSK
jgi:hypothetical protein